MSRLRISKPMPDGMYLGKNVRIDVRLAEFIDVFEGLFDLRRSTRKRSARFGATLYIFFEQKLVFVEEDKRGRPVVRPTKKFLRRIADAQCAFFGIKPPSSGKLSHWLA